MRPSPLFGEENHNSPTEDQLEISLFGPGVGECVVVHLGRGQWAVVDSCCPTGSSEPIVLTYLRALDVRVENAVRLIVATHWHSDHTRGIAKLLEACPRALFACSSALRSTEFATLLATFNQRPMTLSSGVEEMGEVFSILKERSPSRRTIEARWATADKILYADFANGVEVRALSPSDAADTLTRREIGERIPEPGMPKRRAVATTPNQNSVVLWVRSGNVRILLGADLEASPNAAIGWTAIVDSPNLPLEKAEIFKVPHHGAANADEPRVWQEMLAGNPVAVLSQYASGSKPLPTADDLRRLSSRTDRLYWTGPARGWKPRSRGSMVDRMLRQTTRDRRAITGPMGHIRLRRSLLDHDATVQIFLDNSATNGAS